MDFPESLFPNPAHRELILGALALFEDQPLFLTDRLANTIYFNGPAEGLFAERGEAIVNRAVFSLLGMGDHTAHPPALVEALEGNGPPWKAVAQLPLEPPCICVCEASAIRDADTHLCGMVRLRPMPISSVPGGIQ